MPGMFPIGTLLELASFGPGMPGVELALIGTGLFEKPGGIFAGSRLTAAFALLVLTVVVTSVVEQAKVAANEKKIKVNKKFFIIK